jgi:hypothetical protein
MASSDQVKRYLSYWFQLGKPLVIDNGRETLLPNPVSQGDRYSPEFEACWQRVMELKGKNCYLEGTAEKIDELLSSKWEISPCARCSMPVPMVSLGAQSLECPCNDLQTWPNSDLPQPRSPVDSQGQLEQIRDRLLSRSHSTAHSHSTPPQN